MGDRPAGHADACAQEADGAVPVSLRRTSPVRCDALLTGSSFLPLCRQFHAAETAMPARTRPFERRNHASALHGWLTCTPSISRSSRAPSASRRRTRRTSFSVRRSNFAPPPVHASDSCLPSLHSRRVPKQERARARYAAPQPQRRALPTSAHDLSSACADDGVGPTIDEFFTLSLGGMVTVSAPTFASLSAAALCVLTAPLPRAAPQHVGGEHFCRRCAALPLTPAR